MIGGPDDPEMCTKCLRFVPLGERCEGCGEYVVDFSESGPENATFRQCERHGVWLVNGARCEICEREASVVPPVPGWALNGVYGSAFVHWAQHGRRPNEFLLEATPGISENVAKGYKKDREGTVAITSQRVVFISRREGMKYHDIELGAIGRVSFDGRRPVFCKIYAAGETVVLMLGKDQGIRFERALNTARQRLASNSSRTAPNTSAEGNRAASPDRRRLGLFAEAAKYARNMRLSEEHLEAVERAAKEFAQKREQGSVKWLFTNGDRPFLVSVGRYDLYAFSATGMFLYRTNTSGKTPTFTRNRLGYVEAISVGGEVFEKLLPAKKIEPLITQMAMLEVDSLELRESSEVPFDVAQLSEVALGSLIQVLTSSDIKYEIKGDVLLVDYSAASETDRLLRRYSTLPSETDGAVEDQTSNEEDGNQEQDSTPEGRIRRLIQMHDDGLITESELSERRREILREI